ncbi:MAG: HNH endonuclease [Pseudomonadota bacterium]
MFPRQGAKVWYDDQRRVHDQIYSGQDVVDYAFLGDDPEVADNRWLREACEDQTPAIYCLGIAPGQYKAILPVFVVGWDAANLKVQIAFSEDERASKPPCTALERRYGLRAVKQRLHQAQFRAAVISAYGGRCAPSNLPEARLLDAAHIVPDADEVWGAPFVPNGLPLSKIHHAAFDAHLIGIDPDFRLHVAAQLMEQRDGPVLEALKAANGNSIRLPKRQTDRPDRDRLAMRFERFRKSA